MSELEDTVRKIENHKENQDRMKKLDEEFRKEDFEWNQKSKQHNKQLWAEYRKADRQIMEASFGLVGASAKYIGSCLLQGLILLTGVALIGGVIYGGVRCSAYMSSDANYDVPKKVYAVEEKINKNYNTLYKKDSLDFISYEK